MSFDVDQTALAALRQLLDRGSQDASEMKRYWHNNAGVDFLGEGLINLFRDTDDSIENNIERYLDMLSQTTLPGIAEAVATAAKHYRATDSAAAERLDNSMPGTDVLAASKGDLGITFDYQHPSPAFSDAGEPTDELKSLPDFNTKMPYQPELDRSRQPHVTAAGRDLGRHQARRHAGHLRPPVRHLRGGPETGLRRLGRHEGHRRHHDESCERAGHPAHQSRPRRARDEHQLARQRRRRRVRALPPAPTLDLRRQRRPDQARQGVRRGCRGVYNMSSVIGNILSDVTDAAVAAAAAGAATGALTASGVGVPAALLVGAFTLTKVYRVVKEVYNIIKIIADMTSRVTRSSAPSARYRPTSASSTGCSHRSACPRRRRCRIEPPKERGPYPWDRSRVSAKPARHPGEGG